MIFIRSKQRRLRLATSEYDELRGSKCSVEMDGGVNCVARNATLKSITNICAVIPGTTPSET